MEHIGDKQNVDFQIVAENRPIVVTPLTANKEGLPCDNGPNGCRVRAAAATAATAADQTEVNQKQTARVRPRNIKRSISAVTLTETNKYNVTDNEPCNADLEARSQNNASVLAAASFHCIEYLGGEQNVEFQTGAKAKDSEATHRVRCDNSPTGSHIRVVTATAAGQTEPNQKRRAQIRLLPRRLTRLECNLSAVLGGRLADVSQADGAVSLEYLRGHVQRLDEAVAKAGQIGLRDEALLDSAVAELESSKLILAHATFMQSCIDKSPLKGCGTGTDTEVTSALSTLNIAFERALELGMFGAVAVADELWNLLVQLDQVNTHIATLRECIEQIRLKSANAAEQVAKTGMHRNNHAVDNGENSLSNFIEDMVHEAMGSDEAKGVGDPNALSTQDTKPLAPAPGKPTEVKPPARARVHARQNEHGSPSYNEFEFNESDDECCDSDDDERDFQDLVNEYYSFQDLVNDAMQGVTGSSELPDDVQRHVAKAAAMLDVYADDLVDDGSHPELYRCVEKLRSALVQAEELGMAKADLVVVAAGTELLQRFPGKSKWDSRSSTFGSSGADKTISEDEVLALSVLDLCAELGERKDCAGELRDDLGVSAIK